MPSPILFEAFPPAEQQEFQDCCERRRYNRKEFEVISIETDLGLRAVTVTRQGNENYYKASEDHDWLAVFDADLANGYFGMP